MRALPVIEEEGACHCGPSGRLLKGRHRSKESQGKEKKNFFGAKKPLRERGPRPAREGEAEAKKADEGEEEGEEEDEDEDEDEDDERGRTRAAGGGDGRTVLQQRLGRSRGSQADFRTGGKDCNGAEGTKKREVGRGQWVQLVGSRVQGDSWTSEKRQEALRLSVLTSRREFELAGKERQTARTRTATSTTAAGGLQLRL